MKSSALTATAAASLVFLGGSCDPTTWRKDSAMPALDSAGLSYFNPQVADYSGEDARYKELGYEGGIAEFEGLQKAEAKELLFVIDGQTRAIASILEATEYIASGREVTLVIDDMPDGTVVASQTVTGRELKDLNRARNYLRELAKRHSGNATVFSNVEEAVQHIISKNT